MIALLLALQFALPQDSVMLAQVADSVGIPRRVFYAVAWQETRDGRRLNEYVGPGREQCDSLGCRRVCREIGRGQINPCITWTNPHCRRDLLLIYEHNIRCMAAILAAADGTWVDRIRKYNGSGPMARKYLKDALSYIGWMSLQ